MELDLENPHNRTIGHILEERVRMNPDKKFLLYKQESVSYGKLNQIVNSVANSFLNIGVSKGDKVCILLPNCPEFLYAWFALAKIGAIEVPVNTAFRGDFLSHIINNSDAKMLVIDEHYLDALKFIEDDLRALEKVIVVNSNTEHTMSLRFSVIHFSELYLGSSNDPAVPVQHTDVMSIIYTSGTTGASKGVMCSHNYSITFGRDLFEARKGNEEDVFYTCLPLYHSMAQTLNALPALIGGATFALSDRFSASNFWDEVRGYGATHISAIGAMMEILWNLPESPSERNHSVKVCFAGPIPLHVYEQGRERWGINFMEGFGLTESGALSYQNTLDSFRPSSVGKVSKHYEVRIVDDNDEEVPPGTIGEIISRPLRPFTMMEGYYKMPDKTAEAFRNLWFHTGDYGKRDEDGYLYFVDRKKDSIRRRGENISSFEVERIVNNNPKVAESAAVAVPSEVGEDEVKICVILKQGEELLPEELLRWCEDRIPFFAIPRYIEFMKEFPKTGTERTQKHKLRETGVGPETWDREKAGFKIKR